MSEEARKEQQYIRMLKKLYQTARKAEPFSDESRDILMSIEALRKTYENEALPVITAINAENVSCFEDLIPADLSEEIAVKKSRAIGILRVGKEDGALTAASSAVFFVEPAAETGARVLRIKWLYVHPLYRDEGTGNALVAELLNLVYRENINGITIDIPFNGQAQSLKELLEKWQFTFEKGMEPDLIIRLSDIKNTEDFLKADSSVKSLASLGKITSRNMAGVLFRKDGYEGFLKNAPGNYSEPPLCDRGDSPPVTFFLSQNGGLKMGLITEEMALEYHRCRIYKDYIEQLQISEKNENDSFMNSLRCSTVYVPSPAEVTEKYRKEATEQGIDPDWIERFMPRIKKKGEKT